MAGKKQKSDARFEIAFFEGVLRHAPDFIEALICLGDLYTKEGYPEKGLRVDQRLARLRPEDPVILYNLACSYSLMDELPAARRTMAAALEIGYDDVEYLLKDADLRNLLEDGEFRSMLQEWRTKRSARRPQEAA